MSIHDGVHKADITGQLVESFAQSGESFFVAVELFGGVGEHILDLGEPLCVLLGAPF